MPQPPRTLTPLLSAWDLLGSEVRHWRLSKGMSQRELGDRSHHSPALIGKVEKAERRPTRDLVRRLDVVLGSRGALEELWIRATTEAAREAGTLSPGPSQDVDDESVRRGRVAPADVEALTVMAKAFADADHACGGAHVRPALEEYLTRTLQPVLDLECPASLRPALHTAAAQVLDVAGFVAFDSGDHPAAARRYGQALDLLAVAENPTMTAHVHTDLAMLALERDEANRAGAHAQSAATAARVAGSHAGEARALALLARAHGAAGDLFSCRRALDRARETLERAEPDGESPWVTFFTVDQWATESVYALVGVAAPAELETLCEPVLRRCDRMHRRRLLLSTTLAARYCLRRASDPAFDVERAAGLVIAGLSETGRIGSARSLARIDSVRRSVRAAGKLAVAEELDDAVTAALSA